MKRLFQPRNRHRGGEARPVWSALVPVARRILAPAAAALLLAVGLPIALAGARRHAYFAVHTIEFHHRGRLPAEAVRAGLGIAVGDRIWDVDVAAAAERLRALPWVRTASVRRVLPDRIVVRVREYRPAAIVATGGGGSGLYYVAANGRIFAEIGDTDGRDLPYVTGLDRGELDGREGFGPRAVHRALALLRLASREVYGLGPVSEVHVERDGGLTLLPVRPAVPIALGTGGYARKLERVGRVLPLWASRESELDRVSCTGEDEVIVRTRSGRAAGPGRDASGA